jgi:uncharacterized protein (DUF1501 family)
MDSTRRTFLQQAGACVLGATALPTAAPAVARGASNDTKARKPTLVAVYLRGGADALSAIVPYAEKNYPEIRPSLAIPGPDVKGRPHVLTLDDRFGFNPNLKELHALYHKGLCVPIVCAGSPHPTRSHFDAQDFMERAAPGLRNVATGWLNRYLHETRSARDASLRALSLQPLLPRSLRGNFPVLAQPDQKAEQAMAVYAQLYAKERYASPAPRPAAGAGQTKQAIQEFGMRTITQLRELDELLARPVPTTARYPASGFGRQLRDIAKVIKADRGLEVTALDYGGWDHHIDEGPVNGAMGRMLSDVSAAIGAFVEDLGPKRMDQVLLLLMSEFGRTVHENGNKGTDHGHGGFMLAVGSRVQGKRVYGKWTGLDERHLYEGRDLPVHTDFRVVFAETLKEVFDFDGIKAGLFHDYTPASPPLGFLRSA